VYSPTLPSQRRAEDACTQTRAGGVVPGYSIEKIVFALDYIFDSRKMRRGKTAKKEGMLNWGGSSRLLSTSIHNTSVSYKY